MASPKFSPDELLNILTPIPNPIRASPFPELAKSNLPPNELEISSINKLIQETESELGLISDALGSLKKLEIALNQRREDRLAYEATHKTMLSAIRRLPTEILADIFTICIEKDSRFIDVATPPWTLAHTCQRWRLICRSTPSLWVGIPALSLDRGTSPGYLNLLRIMLELSNPMHFSFEIDSLLAEPSPSHPTMQVVAPHLHRASSMTLIPVNAAFLRTFISNGKATHIQEVRLCFSGNDADYTDMSESLSFSMAQTLKLSWDWIRAPNIEWACLKTLNSSWPSLTSFHAHLIPEDFVLSVIVHAPLLREVHFVGGISFHRESIIDSTQLTPILHERLDTLIMKPNIRGDSSGEAILPDIIFLSLRLPCLRELRIAYGALSNDDSFLNFIRETRESLVVLELRHVPLRALAHRDVLRLCPRLEKLKIMKARNLDLQALYLEADGSRPPICPLLKHLSLSLLFADVEDLKRMANSRIFRPSNSEASNNNLTPFSITVTVNEGHRDLFCCGLQDLDSESYGKLMVWKGLVDGLSIPFKVGNITTHYMLSLISNPGFGIEEVPCRTPASWN